MTDVAGWIERETAPDRPIEKDEDMIVGGRSEEANEATAGLQNVERKNFESKSALLFA